MPVKPEFIVGKNVLLPSSYMVTGTLRTKSFIVYVSESMGWQASR